MPFANEHACRIRRPGDFQANSFRRISQKSDGKRLDIIIGRLKGKTTTTTQAFRYPKDDWSASAARSHCTEHDGILFEPATSKATAMEHTIETRLLCHDIEVRQDDRDGDDKVIHITGVAAPFDKLSQDLGGFCEKIEKGAFEGAIKRSDVVGLFNHNPDHLLGRQSAKTLRLRESDRGLEFDMDLPDTQLARDVAENIRAKNITGNSFSFIVKVDEWDKSDKKMAIRTIKEFDRLFDVGPVTFPAYKATKVAARSLELAKPEPKPMRRHQARQRAAEVS